METKLDKSPDELLSLYESGMTICEIAERHGVSRQRVSQLLKKRGYIARRYRPKPTPLSREEKKIKFINGRKAKFLSMLKKTDSGCLEFTGLKHSITGYGCFRFSGIGEITAHRVAWVIARGPIPADKDICHTCDNPICCNIEHLYLGTKSQNMQDREIRGRGNRHPGNRSYHQNIKLSILKDYESGISIVDLAKKFGYTKQWIYYIVKGIGAGKLLREYLPVESNQGVLNV